MKRTLLTSLLLLFTIVLVNAQTVFSSKLTINGSTGANPYVMDTGELSGDLFNDIVIGTFSGNQVQWYKNNGDDTFTLQTLISTTLIGVTGVHIADLNNDTFNDVLVASFTNDKLVWFANDGSGNFGTEQIISSSIDGAGVIVTGLIDAGPTVDVAVVAYNSGDTVWFSNNGSGSFTGPNTIASVPSSGPGDLDLADFDGDGDLDAVIANTDGGNVELYDNRLVPDGTVSFVKYTNSISTGNIYLFDVSFADVDDDNNLEIMKADSGLTGMPGEVAWYKNDAAGTSTTFTENIISTTMANPATITVADMDNDGNNDVVISNGDTLNQDISWYESTDSGTLNAETDIEIAERQVFALSLVDLDNDGDLDIASVAYQDNDLVWHENLLETLGLEDNSINEISIYPNPTKGKLYFKGLNDSDLNVSVYDILGKNILKTTLSINSTLDVSKLKNGIYIIKFNNYNTAYKFVKE